MRPLFERIFCRAVEVMVYFAIAAIIAWFIGTFIYVYNGGNIDDLLYLKEKNIARIHAQAQEKIVDKKIELLKRQLESK